MKSNKNTEILLKETISNNINELKRKKILEKKEITKKINLLIEGKNFNKKSDTNKFLIEFWAENERLLAKGYNQELISEELNNTLFTILGGVAGHSILSLIKEYVAKWFIEKTGISPNSTMASVIIVALGNLKFGDIPNMYKCDFWVPKLAESIIEGIVRKMQVDRGVGDNPFSIGIRNAIEKMIGDSEFAKLLEKQLVGIVCPLLPDLSDKINKVTTKLTPKKEV